MDTETRIVLQAIATGHRRIATSVEALIGLPAEPEAPDDEAPVDAPPVVVQPPDPEPDAEGWTPRVPPAGATVIHATAGNQPHWPSLAPGAWVWLARGQNYTAFPLRAGITVCAEGPLDLPMPIINPNLEGDGVEMWGDAQLFDLDLWGGGSGDGLTIHGGGWRVEGCWIRGWKDNIQITNQPSADPSIMYRCNILDSGHEGISLWPARKGETGAHNIRFVETILDGHTVDHAVYALSSMNISWVRCLVSRSHSGWRVRGGVAGGSNNWFWDQCFSWRNPAPIELVTELDERPQNTDGSWAVAWWCQSPTIQHSQFLDTRQTQSVIRLEHVVGGKIEANTITGSNPTPNPVISLGGIQALDIAIRHNILNVPGVGIKCKASLASGVSVVGNLIQMFACAEKANPKCLDIGANVVVAGNSYYSEGNPSEWFIRDGVRVGMAAWPQIEPTATMLDQPQTVGHWPMDDATLDQLRQRRFGVWYRGPWEKP